MTPRAAAARSLAQTLEQGRSLAETLPPALARLAPGDRALCQDLCYGVLRWHCRLLALADALLQRRPREGDLLALLLVGLYQLEYQSTAPHAAVSQTVEAARELGRGWATGLVNGVLRRFTRERARLAEAVDRDPARRLAHPPWLLERLQADWPEHWQEIARQNNLRPPMTLRVNRRRWDLAAARAALAAAGLEAQPVPGAADALVLARPRPVDELPGFADGRVSVQDAAAQLAASLLGPQPGERILDACAAPGGKTGHLLERADLDLLALDQAPARLSRVAENLERLGLAAELRAGDAGSPGDWWDGRPFQRILVDAPCSGSGVIRRHPDIKWLRRPADPAALATEQARLLAGLWPTLAPGGKLVYSTCSVLAEENEAVVRRFMEEHPDAAALPVVLPGGVARGAGAQVLPAPHLDGFYYAVLQRR